MNAHLSARKAGRIVHLLAAAMLPGRRLTVDEFTEKLVRDVPAHVLAGFLAEFGYVNRNATTPLSALRNAVEERGPRIERELVAYRYRGTPR